MLTAMRRAIVEGLEGRLMLSAYTVSTGLDVIDPSDDHLSLREAIQLANLDPGSTINFSSDFTIEPATALPAIAAAMTIDGSANGARVTIVGSTAGGDGLDIDANVENVTLKSLWLNNWDGAAINVDGASATLTDCVLTENWEVGIRVGAGADGTQIMGNWIGTTPAGDLWLGNDAGISVAGGNTTIGGAAAGQRNVISGNYSFGISVLAIAGAGEIVGNYIGVDPTGLAGMGNSGNGIEVFSGNGWLIGGGDAAAGNVISANYDNGVLLDGASHVTMWGNRLGVNAAGESYYWDPIYERYFDLGNNSEGVNVTGGSSDNVIGGTQTGEGNSIANNHGNNVSVRSGLRNAIRGNSIFGDAFMGIDLITPGTGGAEVYGPTPNDSAGHTGPNDYQNFPVMTLARRTGGAVHITGTLNSTASNSFWLDFYSNATVLTYTDLYGGTPESPYRLGQGKTYLCSIQVTTDALGAASFSTTLSGVPDGENWITATATSLSGNTSEFSQAFEATADSAASTTTTLAAAPNPATYGDGVAVTASVMSEGEAVKTGTVHFAYGSFAADVDLDQNGAATWELAGLPAGTHTITAHYLGNNQYVESNATLDQQVLKAQLTVTADGQSRVYGQANPTLTYTVSGFVNGETVSVITGAPDLTTTADAISPVGTYPISAAVGTLVAANYDFTFVAGILTINQAETSTLLVSSASSVGIGDPVTFTATVSAVAPGAGMPTGSVIFTDGTDNLGMAIVADGIATLTLSNLPEGSALISAQYVGDINFLASESPAIEVVVESAFSLSGRTLKDVTGNGLSSDDAALSGVTVNLYQDLNGDGVLSSADGSPVASAISAADGSYRFTPGPAGRYFVQEVKPANAVLTWPILNDYYTADAADGIASGLDFANFLKLCTCGVTNITYTIEHGCQTTTVTDLRGHVRQGDTVTVTFTVPESHIATVSLISYLTPSAVWDAENAYQQRIYDVETASNIGGGIYTLTVEIPQAYFQVDFICGLPIDRFGPAGSNITYSSQGRLFSADNGGTQANLANTATLSGTVFLDADADGEKDSGESGIPAVTLEVSDASGVIVAIARTSSSGTYSVNNLAPGVYCIKQIQPRGFVDGESTIGSLGGDNSEDSNVITSIGAGANQNGTGYNFAELRETDVTAGDTASIGFWNSKNGQYLIKSFNGSASSRNLASFLSRTYPSIYGNRSANCLVNKTNSDVASLFTRLFARSDKLDAQVLAVALATYATKLSLGGMAAAKYGFTVWSDGTGSRQFDIGGNGDAFGVANGALMSVSAILAATNQRTVRGVLYNGNALLRLMANNVFADINSQGDVAG